MEREWAIAGVMFRVTMPGDECSRTDDRIIQGNVVHEVEQHVLWDIACHGPMTPRTLSYMRRCLNVKRAELASHFDVSVDTLRAWETDGGSVPGAVWDRIATMVLATLGKEPAASPSICVTRVRGDR